MILRSHVTTRLHDVFDLAHSLAEQAATSEISASHLLLALLREGQSLAAQYLQVRGVPVRDLEEELASELRVQSDPRPIEPDRAWTPADEVWLSAAHREAADLWPEHLEIRKVASTETLLLALLSDSLGRLASCGISHADCQVVVRWAHQPSDDRGELPPYRA